MLKLQFLKAFLSRSSESVVHEGHTATPDLVFDAVLDAGVPFTLRTWRVYWIKTYIGLRQYPKQACIQKLLDPPLIFTRLIAILNKGSILFGHIYGNHDGISHRHLFIRIYLTLDY